MKNYSLSVAVLAILLIGVVAYANNQQNNAPEANLFHGKVVIINPSSISTPHENARIEDLAGRKYLVYQVRPEEGNAYDSWTAVEDISRLRVFQNMNDAKAFLKQEKNK